MTVTSAPAGVLWVGFLLRGGRCCDRTLVGFSQGPSTQESRHQRQSEHGATAHAYERRDRSSGSGAGRRRLLVGTSSAAEGFSPVAFTGTSAVDVGAQLAGAHAFRPRVPQLLWTS